MLIQVHSKPSRRTTYHHHGCKGAGSPTATVRFLHECLVRFVGVPPTDHAFSELLELLGPLLGPLLHKLLLKHRTDPTHEHVLVEPSARLYGHLPQEQLHLPSSAQSGAIRGNLARAAPPAQSTGGIRGNLRGRSEPPDPKVLFAVQAQNAIKTATRKALHPPAQSGASSDAIKALHPPAQSGASCRYATALRAQCRTSAR